MQKEVDYLSEWFSRYMKNRDIAFRKIKDIKSEGDKVIITENSGLVTVYYIIPFIEDFSTIIKGLEGASLGIVTFNTPEAFDSLLKSWDGLVKLPSLVIYFFNPFSQQEKKWIIRPRTHHMISDEESLKEGLKSLYLTVDPVNKKEIGKIIG